MWNSFKDPYNILQNQLEDPETSQTPWNSFMVKSKLFSNPNIHINRGARQVRTPRENMGRKV